MLAAKKPASILISLLGSAGILFALVAAKCETTTEFPPFVQEICTDNTDNDEDGLVDCKDSDCDVACKVEVVVFTPSPTTADSLRLSGTHQNASSIAVTVSSGGGTATTPAISGSDWTCLISGISTVGSHTVTITASGNSGLKDTAITTFEKRN